MLKAANSFIAVLEQAFESLLHTLFLVELGFREEFVSETYHLFLQTDRAHIATRDRKLLTFNFFQ